MTMRSYMYEEVVWAEWLEAQTCNLEVLWWSSNQTKHMSWAMKDSLLGQPIHYPGTGGMGK